MSVITESDLTPEERLLLCLDVPDPAVAVPTMNPFPESGYRVRFRHRVPVWEGLRRVGSRCIITFGIEYAGYEDQEFCPVFYAGNITTVARSDIERLES